MTATNADGSNQALSGATAPIAAIGTVPANTKQPDPVREGAGRPDGHASTTASWSGQKPITFSYQWQACTAAGAACTDVAGATGQSYLVASSQVGSTLRATVTATNSAGKASASSNLTAAVIAKTAGSPVNTSAAADLRLGVGRTHGSGLDRRLDRASRRTRSATSGAAVTRTGRAAPTSRARPARATASAQVDARQRTPRERHRDELDRLDERDLGRVDHRGDGRPDGRLQRRPPRESGGPPPDADARAGAAGHFTAKLTGKTLRWTLTFSHLSGRPTVAGLNTGLRGMNGAAFKTLCRSCYSPSHGTLTLTASQRRLDAARADVREHPHDEKPPRRDPRPDQPRELAGPSAFGL